MQNTNGTKPKSQFSKDPKYTTQKISSKTNNNTNTYQTSIIFQCRPITAWTQSNQSIPQAHPNPT